MHVQPAELSSVRAIYADSLIFNTAIRQTSISKVLTSNPHERIPRRIVTHSKRFGTSSVSKLETRLRFLAGGWPEKMR